MLRIVTLITSIIFSTVAIAEQSPTHYGFKSASRLDEMEAEYERLAAQKTADFQPMKILNRLPQPKLTRSLANAAAKVIAGQDLRGAWVEPATHRNRSKIATGAPSIHCRTFASNIMTLAKFVAAKVNTLSSMPSENY